MKINLNQYDIQIGEDTMDKIDESIRSFYPYKEIFIITDDNVFKLYKDFMIKKLSSFTLHFISIEPFESSKSLKTYERVINQLLDKKIRKNNLIIALGGGVVGDLAGFVAATLFRGVDFIQIPTTLLAMVDSSIGGKTGIDLNQGKNLIGAFKNPVKVFIDPIFLSTLPKVEYKNGLAETLKAGLIGNPKLYEYLKVNDKLTINEIIMAIEVKADIVKKDPFEKNERMFLNFGHTFGHAIERHYDYAIKHGVAISYGMLFSLELGIKSKVTNPLLFDEVKKILLRLELIKEPILDKEQFIGYIQYDKKNYSDGLRFVYLKDVGKPIIQKGVQL
ncbi:3-dehydroquinate synthase [Acholeplasma granularum]|uniref:3-dehydroquinate synthase n=1 Tax=Acholeplasma granularum TaxID=264635 RepID=UPI0004AEA4D9|nr:3-dehydroquinate synthase [Acholeplasma granularum]